MCSTCRKRSTQMNIQLANVISDVVGETGQKILRAIVAGERFLHVLDTAGRPLSSISRWRDRLRSAHTASSGRNAPRRRP